jgi:excisionase family DNA binding protein
MRPEANRLYLTTGEVATRLRVRPRAVRWLIRTGQLTAQRIGEEFLIKESDLAEFIDAHIIRAHPAGADGGIEGTLNGFWL